MIRPDRSLNQSLVRLQDASPEIVQWIKDSLEEQKDVNIDFTGENGIRGQGKAEVLRDMLAFIVAAPEILKKRDNGESQQALRSTRGY